MEKEIYVNLCEQNSIPIFSQHYWMDAVCGENKWDVLFAENNGNIIATLPYYLNGNEITKAPLTQNNGLFFYYPIDLKDSNKLDYQIKASQSIIDEIENLDIQSFRQYFHYSFTNWLPFYWSGYTQSTRYTYVINDTKNLDILHQNMNSNTRKNIRKAEKLVEINEMTNPIEFYNLVIETFERQGLKTPYNLELFLNIYNVLVEREQCKILEARDLDGNIHSCAMFVWDDTSVYYLISGSKINYRNSQSLSLLIWEGIKLAHKLGKKFDFEGSMKQNIEQFFRGFGPEQIPYFDISKNYK